jgi:hypothetical protein
MRRRDFYEQSVGPLRIERRSMVVSAWEPWNIGAHALIERGDTDA